jgi:hypothetical protein
MAHKYLQKPWFLEISVRKNHGDCCKICTVFRVKIRFKGGIKDTWGVGREIFMQKYQNNEYIYKHIQNKIIGDEINFINKSNINNYFTIVQQFFFELNNLKLHN